MEISKKPHIIEFPKIGSSALGYISLAEKDKLPFKTQRVYWTYFTPEDVERGNHAHFELLQASHYQPKTSCRRKRTDCKIW